MKRIKTPLMFVIAALAAVMTIMICVGAGSVFIPPEHVAAVFANALFGSPLPSDIQQGSAEIILSVRTPRVLLAFITGAALSVSGAAVQSVLRNPLASPFTLGTSAGASLGASLAIASGITVFGGFTSAVFGLTGAIITMFAMVGLAKALDGSLQSSTVVLTGMVLSLFISAVVTLIANIADEKYKQIMQWQSGSFSGRGWEPVVYLGAVLLLCTALFILFSRQLDLHTFGDEQAQSAGLDTRKYKAVLLILASVLSGTAVAFAGVIGFVDLIAPHIARRLFGVRHKILIPMSAILGGAFMALCDLAARVAVIPNELPVGVVTSLLGAPFFAYIYFRRRGRKV